MKRTAVTMLVACLLLSTLSFTVAADETKDIPANAQATGSHDQLVAALAHVELVAALQADGPFTVFAPTDAAFEAAGIDLKDFDNDEANATLTDILLYHVYNGSVNSSTITDGLTVTMLNGDNVTFTVTNETVIVGNATVTTVDVMASNGIIHVIDTVLLPPVEEAEEEVVPDPFEGVDCAVTVGVASAGYEFISSVVNINVGETVCWSWEDASMPHNVKQVDGFKSTTYTTGGITSGAAASTVAFYHTFNEDTTFYYACEPHIGLNMYGEVIVGDGGPSGTSSTDDDVQTNDTPGFMLAPAVLAMLGAVLVAGRRILAENDEA